MLVRLVSNFWPCDLSALASQSAGIIDLNHRAWPGMAVFLIHKVADYWVTSFSLHMEVYFKYPFKSVTDDKAPSIFP